MIQASWMYADAGSNFIGGGWARRNPMLWTRHAPIDQAADRLENLLNQSRPIRIRVRNHQDHHDQQRRSFIRVEQRFANARSATASLRALHKCLLEAEDGTCDSHIDSSDDHPIIFNDRLASYDDNAELPLPEQIPDVSRNSIPVSGRSGMESFYSCESVEMPGFQGSVPGVATFRSAIDPFSSAQMRESSDGSCQSSKCSEADGNWFMDVLRAHLTTGSPVLSKWMWGDAGLTAVLPSYLLLAERNPWRWSRPKTLDETVAELDGFLSSSNACRPVRLEIFSSAAEDKLISFSTTAESIAHAGSLLWEIHFMVQAVYAQEEEAREALSSFDDEKFQSFQSFHTEALSMRRPSRRSTPAESAFKNGSGSSAEARNLLTSLKKRPRTNANSISSYQWLTELLRMITEGSAVGAARDVGASQSASPLFVVAGFCPNSFTGMQAVVYCQLGRTVDFWWAKPQEDDPQRLERHTLDLHTSGRYKNAAGKSRAVYAPLAEKFAGVADQGDFLFGVDGGRAFIQERALQGEPSGGRMLIYFVWQENWSSLFARRKFIEGKICYQWSRPDRKPDAGLFARQYRIEEGQLDIASIYEEEEVTSLLPPDSFQDMYEMCGSAR